MVQQKGKRRTFIIVGAIVALVLIVGIILVVNALGSGKSDPYKQVETTNNPDTSSNDESKNTDTKPAEDSNKTDDTSNEPTLDPATVSTVVIEPMQITVSYVKVNAGFEYYVTRTASGTQYVEFSSPELVGTKCTDDKGVFASIIESPSATESTTLSKTTTVDDTKYGLSLADATCTKDPELLKQFQSSFSDAFSLLKRS